MKLVHQIKTIFEGSIRTDFSLHLNLPLLFPFFLLTNSYSVLKIPLPWEATPPLLLGLSLLGKKCHLKGSSWRGGMFMICKWQLLKRYLRYWCSCSHWYQARSPLKKSLWWISGLENWAWREQGNSASLERIVKGGIKAPKKSIDHKSDRSHRKPQRGRPSSLVPKN